MRSRGDKQLRCYQSTIVVIAVAPTGKASFVYSYMQMRLMGQYNGKWPFSLIYALKPLITVIRAISANLHILLLLKMCKCPRQLHCKIQAAQSIGIPQGVQEFPLAKELLFSIDWSGFF